MEARKTLEKMKEQLNLQIEENRIVVKFHETVISYYLGEVSEQCAIEKIKRLMKTVIEDNNIVFYHIPMRNEVLMINQLFISAFWIVCFISFIFYIRFILVRCSKKYLFFTIFF